MEGGMSLYSFSDSNNMVILVYVIMYIIFKYDCFKPKKLLN